MMQDWPFTLSCYRQPLSPLLPTQWVAEACAHPTGLPLYLWVICAAYYKENNSMHIGCRANAGGLAIHAIHLPPP